MPVRLRDRETHKNTYKVFEPDEEDEDDEEEDTDDDGSPH